jgi:hypothetical protein
LRLESAAIGLMHDQSDYLQRAEQFEVLAEKTSHAKLKPLYRQLAAEYRSMAAAIATPSNVRPQDGR